MRQSSKTMGAKRGIMATVGFVSIALLALFAACAPTTELSGTATKGPIDGATVTAYALNADGSRGTAVATATTSATGGFQLQLGQYAGAVVVVVSNGSYTDETTGETVTLGAGNELETIVATPETAGTAAVTALTTIAATRTRQMLRDNSATGLQTAAQNANRAVATAFGLPETVDIAQTVPVDLTTATAAAGATDAQVAYAAVQSGLTQVAQTNGLQAQQVLQLVGTLAEDFESGAFDGVCGDGTAVQTGLSVTPVQAMNGLQTAVQAFMNSERNQSGRTSPGVAVPSPSGSGTGAGANAN